MCIYLYNKTGQTARPNGLHFFVDTQGFPGGVLSWKIDFCSKKNIFQNFFFPWATLGPLASITYLYIIMWNTVLYINDELILNLFLLAFLECFSEKSCIFIIYETLPSVKNVYFFFKIVFDETKSLFMF